MNMQLTRWNPLREMEDWMERWNCSYGLAPRRDGGEEVLTTADWTPAVDIRGDDKEYVLQMDLPQVKKEDVKITVENGVLTIRGECRAEKKHKDAQWHRVERSIGTRLRTFTLPDDVREEGVEARVDHGVLHVYLAESAPAQPKSREIPVRQA